MPDTSWSANTVIVLTLAGREGRITPLILLRFFLFGVAVFLVLSLPGYLKEVRAGGVFKATCGWSLRFLARVFLAFSTFGTARAAIFVAALTSLSSTPCSRQIEISCTGCVTLEPQRWHSCDVFAAFTDTTQQPF